MLHTQANRPMPQAGEIVQTHLQAKCSTIYCISQYANTIFRFFEMYAKNTDRVLYLFYEWQKPSAPHLEIALRYKEGCIDSSGSYTGPADSMPLRTCRGSAAQRQPANTRPEARAQEMARKAN